MYSCEHLFAFPIPVGRLLSCITRNSPGNTSCPDYTFDGCVDYAMQMKWLTLADEAASCALIQAALAKSLALASCLFCPAK